jgi:hypothetical protein
MPITSQLFKYLDQCRENKYFSIEKLYEKLSSEIHGHPWSVMDVQVNTANLQEPYICFVRKYAASFSSTPEETTYTSSKIEQLASIDEKKKKTLNRKRQSCRKIVPVDY